MVDELYKKLYEILFFENNPKEALEKLKILGEKTGDRDYETLNLLRAFALLFMDDLKGAELIASNVNLPEAQVLKAITDIKKLRFREGREILMNYIYDGENKYVKAEALYRLIQLYILLNDMESARKTYDELLQFAIVMDMLPFRWMNEINKARMILATTGNVDLAINILEVAEKGLMESRNINRRIVSQILLAYNEGLRGNRQKSLNYLKNARSLSLLSGSSLVQGLVYYYECIVNKMFGLMDSEVCNRAMNLIELSGDEIMKTEIKMDRAKHLIKENRLEEAEISIVDLINRLGDTEYKFKLPFLMYYLAETKLLMGDLEKTIELVDRYESEYGSLNPFLYITMLHLKISALSRKGNMEEALKLFYKTLDLTQEYELQNYWTRDVDDLLDKLRTVLKEYLKKEDLVPPYLIKLLLEGGFLNDSVETISMNMERAMDYLDLGTVEKFLPILEKMDPLFREKYSRRIRYRINLLGNFRIIIGNKILTEDNLERPINAKVLKYLIIHRNNFIEREKLIEDIWGDKRSDKTGRTLNTILSNIRKFLHPLGEKNTTIKSSKKNVGFFTDERFSIDVDEFEERVRKGKLSYFSRQLSEAKALLQEAIEMYIGDLLPSDLYEEWIENERERLKNLYISALTTLTEIMKKEGFMGLAISILEEALYRYPDRQIYENLLHLLKENGQDDRIKYWENYIENVLFSKS